MATKVHMEALSPTMEEGQLVRWLKSEGDPVSNGEVLAEIETDKATMELVARGEGVLRKVLIPEGATAPVGEVIAVIAGADEDISGLLGAGRAAVLPETPQGTPELQIQEASQAGKDHPAPLLTSVGGRVKASPLARRLAREADLDLLGVHGSGPGGRIVMRDVEAAKAGAGVASVAPVSRVGAGTTPAPAPGVDFEDIPLSQMRKTIA
ncbi:MAG: biotin/lipoyl-containing protein, partial [Gemmatimonadota bacterium]